MVKFAKHVEAFLDGEHRGSDLYVVPYSNIRDVFIQNAKRAPFPPARSDFVNEWRAALKRSSDDFGTSMSSLWRRVFDVIESDPESRGAVPDRALRMYIAAAGPDGAGELLALVRQIHSTALTNAEALRKLAKKYDKQCGGGGGHVSAELLPEVYAANFTVGQPNLESGLALLRTQLGLDDDDADVEDDEYRRRLNEQRILSADDAEGGEASFLTGPGWRGRREGGVLERRRAELAWLRGLVSSMPPGEIGRIVSHRGFHWPSDWSDTRPLENSLQAYEAAWTSGIHLCECDIALTKDERIILCHDETFARLALDPNSEMAQRKVNDLTLRELFSIPLKTGSRPPLLVDVLRSAQAIGGDSKLVVEIKPGNPEAGTALARLFVRHPELCAHCAVVMSFDAFAMHSLRRELKALDTSVAPTGLRPRVGSVSIPTSMSLGNVGLRIDSVPALAPGGGEEGEEGARAEVETTPGEPRLVQHEKYGVLIPPLVPPRIDSKESFGVGLSVSLHSPVPSRPTPPKILESPLLGKTMADSLPSHPLQPVQSITPKLMLLTVSDEPQLPCHLWLDVDDLSPLDSWLNAEDGSLDGVYMQFQNKMLNPSGARAMKQLSEKYTVGVWELVGRDPDNWETFHHLVTDCAVSYVNSALPKKFMKNKASTTTK